MATGTTVGHCEIMPVRKDRRFDVWYAGYMIGQATELRYAADIAEKMVYPGDVVGWYIAEAGKHELSLTRDQFRWTGDAWGYTLDGIDPLDWIDQTCGCEGDCVKGGE